MPSSRIIEGHVSPGFAAVREAFAENFSRRGELTGDPREMALRDALYSALRP